MTPCGLLAIHHCFWRTVRIRGSWHPRHAAFLLLDTRVMQLSCFLISASCSFLASWYPCHAAFLLLDTRVMQLSCFLIPASCSFLAWPMPQVEIVCHLPHASFLLGFSSIQKMEAIYSSLISINFQRTTWRYIPEDRNLHAVFTYIDEKTGARNGIVSTFRVCQCVYGTPFSQTYLRNYCTTCVSSFWNIRGIQTYWKSEPHITVFRCSEVGKYVNRMSHIFTYMIFTQPTFSYTGCPRRRGQYSIVSVVLSKNCICTCVLFWQVSKRELWMLSPA
jgi:hypothetical protein